MQPIFSGPIRWAKSHPKLSAGLVSLGSVLGIAFKEIIADLLVTPVGDFLRSVFGSVLPATVETMTEYLVSIGVGFAAIVATVFLTLRFGRGSASQALRDAAVALAPKASPALVGGRSRRSQAAPGFSDQPLASMPGPAPSHDRLYVRVGFDGRELHILDLHGVRAFLTYNKKLVSGPGISARIVIVFSGALEGWGCSVQTISGNQDFNSPATYYAQGDWTDESVTFDFNSSSFLGSATPHEVEISFVRAQR